MLAPCGAALLFPAVAEAHGIVGRADLPIPVWLFSWAAAIVLVVSFVALSTLWTTPAAADRAPQAAVQRARTRGVAGERRSGSAVFALVVYSGFAGSQVWSVNFSVTFIYVIFWVGMPVASVLFGDVFAVLSPWRTLRARDRAGLGRRLAPRALRRAPAALPGAARSVAGDGAARRLRLAGAGLRRT